MVYVGRHVSVSNYVDFVVLVIIPALSMLEYFHVHPRWCCRSCEWEIDEFKVS